MPRAVPAFLTCVFLLCLATTKPVFSASAEAPGKLPLAESERVYIATIEHRGATLNLKAFPAVRAAIRAADTAQLKKFFAPNFKGEWLEIPSEISWQAEPVTMRRIVKDSRSSL